MKKRTLQKVNMLSFRQMKDAVACRALSGPMPETSAIIINVEKLLTSTYPKQ
jgi:hypothetical protein